MNCYKTEANSGLNLNSTDYCQTSPNQITYEISQNKVDNPILNEQLSRNNKFNKLSCRSSSEIQYNNNYINNNSNIENNSKGIFRNYIQDRKKELANGKCINFRNKIRNLADEMYNDINKKSTTNNNNKILDRMKKNNIKKNHLINLTKSNIFDNINRISYRKSFNRNAITRGNSFNTGNQSIKPEYKYNKIF